MPTSDRDPLNVPVIIKPHVWREEVERVDVRSLARIAAEREWSRLEDEGLALGQLQRCDELGANGTRLGGLAKVYLPISDAPPSERPFGMIFSPEPGPTLMLVAHAPGSKQRQTKRRSRMKENHIGSRRSQLDQGLVVLCVQGEINRVLTGHGGYQYESPAQARQQAPTLARVLLGYTNGTLHGWDQWSCPIAGGRRTVRLKPQPRREGLRQSTR